MSDKRAEVEIVEPKPMGRPPLFTSPEELEAMVEKYFNGDAPTRKVVTKEGEVIEIPVLTITGLVLYLGFADRKSFYEYENKPDFTHTIKKARTKIEGEYEKLLQGGLGTGAIFALKNFGWQDKTELELSSAQATEESRLKEFMDDTNDDAYPDTIGADASSPELAAGTEPTGPEQVAQSPTDIQE